MLFRSAGALQISFRRKKYSDEQHKIIWANVKDLTEPEFTKIVTSVISSFRNAPLPIDYIEMAKKERRERFNAQLMSELGETTKNASQGDLEALRAYCESIGAANLQDAVNMHRVAIRKKMHENPNLSVDQAGDLVMGEYHG